LLAAERLSAISERRTTRVVIAPAHPFESNSPPFFL
jgi:hypothetical protein